jgi:hypothetical protein
MASNDDNPDEPELVDLLYDDELDDQTAGRLRSKIQDSSPEEAAQLETYEQILERVRETETEKEVPAEVHDSIVDTARDHATRQTEKSAHPEEPAPSPTGDNHSQTIWGRLSSGTNLTHVGTAAAALLACATILYVMRGEVTRPTKSTADSPATSPPSNPAEGVDEAPSETSPSPEPAEKTTGARTAQADEPSNKSDSDEPSRNALEVIRGDNSDESSGSEQPTSADKPANDPRARRKQPPSSKAGDKTSSAPKPEPTQKVKKRAAVGDSPAPEPKETNDDSSEMINSFGGGSIADSSKGKSAGADQTSAPSRSQDGKSADKSKTDDTPTGSADNPLIDVETSYLNNNWSETVKGADLLLASSRDLEPADEARALELKARALEEQGKSGEAHTVFSTIADRFPDYKPDVIQSAVEDTKSDRQANPAPSGDSGDNSSIHILGDD